MKSSFAARRKIRKIGQDEEKIEARESATISQEPIAGGEGTPIVKRPTISSIGSSRSKKRSSLRLSFGPGETPTNDENGAGTEVFTPKKSNLSRQAIEKNALRKSLASLSSDHLPIRQTSERPSYSKDHLNELKSSTPSTPKNIQSVSSAEDEPSQALDIASKFGSDPFLPTLSTIPTSAEIEEKKARRAHLAQQNDFISLSSTSAAADDDDNDTSISLLPRKAPPPSRLVRDDEDFAEGFDSFVDDGGGISLGRKAEREQKRKHKAEIRDLINEAEGGGAGSSNDDSADDSEAERNAEYEAAQTRKGMDGLLHKGDDGYNSPSSSRRPKTPPKITPLPSLDACLERLQAALSQMEDAKTQKVRRREELEREKADIAQREGEIQRLLSEAGENYERLRAEAVADRGLESAGNGVLDFSSGAAGRGLETLGNTPVTNAAGE
ncbi:hypothetical protein MMC06_002273 [Schaereria dolodes]|nr:hypothetical protein [Schaereria dolodes]